MFLFRFEYPCLCIHNQDSFKYLTNRGNEIKNALRPFHRTVTIEEAEEYCNSQDDCCVFVEASAKRNYHVEELFYQLFIVAGLPLEMAPNHHRKVPLTFGSPTMLPPSQVNIC